MILKTSKVDKHSHFAYLHPDRSGITSISSGHSHEIVENVLYPAPDGHMHTLENLASKKITKKNKEKEDNDKVKKVRALYKESSKREDDYRKLGKESWDFVLNKQWNKADEDKLAGDDRSVLTINHTAAAINLLSGYQRQNRTDIRYFPIEGGDAKVADILTALAKHDFEQCNYDFEETLVFKDQAITGRGLFNHYIDYDADPKGKFVIEKFPWQDCGFGPHEKYDLSDCEYLVKSKWFSMSKIKSLWPDKAGDISKDYDMASGSKDHIQHSTDQYAKSDNEYPFASDPDLIDVKRKEFKVLQLEEKEYKRVNVLVAVNDDFYFNADEAGLTDKDIAEIKTIEGIEVVPQNVVKIEITTIAGDTLLSEEYSTLPHDNFSIIPAYAEKHGDDIIGKVEYGKGPQREINKRHSQIADILNRVAGYGWFYDDQTFGNAKEEKNFRKNSSKAGFTQKVMDIGRRPVKEEGVKFPSEIANFAQMEVTQIREILGINPELLGVAGNTQSGVAIMEKKRQGLIGNEYLFDNLSLAKRQIGRFYIAVCKKINPPERMIRILDNMATKGKPAEIGGMPYNPEDTQLREAIMYLWETADLAQYDVAVGESQHNVTNRQANFALWMEMAKTRPEIPIDFLLEMSDMPDKDKYSVILEQARNQQMAIEQGKQQTEIQKTLIAKDKGEAIPQEGMPPQGMM